MDGDQTPDPDVKKLFVLPGPKMAPEIALFNDPSVQSFIHDNYGLILNDFNSTLANIDHHDWFFHLATRVNQSKPTLIVESARAFVRAHSVEAGILVEQLKGALE
jgi:hypothetical protein